MTIPPITIPPEVTNRSTDSGPHGNPSGFAEMLDAARQRSVDGDDTDAIDNRQGRRDLDPNANDLATPDEAAAAAAEAGEFAEVTDGAEAGEAAAAAEENPTSDAATVLLAATLATNELLQPDAASSTEVPAGTVATADIAAALEAGAKAETGAAEAGAGTVSEPGVVAADVAAAQAALAAHAEAHDSTDGPDGPSGGHEAAEVPAGPPTDDGPEVPPVAEGPDGPTGPDAPPVDPNEPAPTPEEPPALPDPVPAPPADDARVDMTDVADALATLDAPVSAPVPDTSLAPRVTSLATANDDTSAPIAPPMQPTAPNPLSSTSAPNAASSTPTPAATPPAPPQEQVAAAMGALQQRADGTYKLRLELHPSELGYVEIDVELRNGVLHAHMRAEHLNSAQALRDAIADLRTRLEAHGMRAGEVTVDGRSAGGAGRDRDTSGAEPRGSDDRDDASTDDDPRPRRQPTPDVNESLLDLRM